MLDPVRDVEAYVLRLEAPRPDDALGVLGARGDPRERGTRMLAAEGLEQWLPVEVALGLLARRPLFAPGVNGLGALVLPRDRARGPGPAVVEHAGVGEAAAYLPVPRADPKALRPLVPTDVRAQPDAAHLAAVPASARREGVEAAVEMEILDEQAFHPLVPVPLGGSVLQESRPRLVQHLVGLDVDAPASATGGHRLSGLDREPLVLLREVPLAVQDADARVVQGRHELAGSVLGLPDVHYHFVTHLEHGADRRDDGEVERERVAHDRNAGQHGGQVRNCRL